MKQVYCGRKESPVQALVLTEEMYSVRSDVKGEGGSQPYFLSAPPHPRRRPSLALLGMA